MRKPDEAPQESNENSEGKQYWEQLEALRVAVAAEIAANAKQADVNRLTEADWEAIKF